MGVSRVSQVHDNVAATELRLRAEQIAALDEASSPEKGDDVRPVQPRGRPRARTWSLAGPPSSTANRVLPGQACARKHVRALLFGSPFSLTKLRGPSRHSSGWHRRDRPRRGQPTSSARYSAASAARPASARACAPRAPGPWGGGGGARPAPPAPPPDFLDLPPASVPAMMLTSRSQMRAPAARIEERVVVSGTEKLSGLRKGNTSSWVMIETSPGMRKPSWLKARTIPSVGKTSRRRARPSDASTDRHHGTGP